MLAFATEPYLIVVVADTDPERNVSMAQDSDVRLANLSPGESEPRRKPTADNSRFAELFRAYAARGIHVEPAI